VRNEVIWEFWQFHSWDHRFIDDSLEHYVKMVWEIIVDLITNRDYASSIIVIV